MQTHIQASSVSVGEIKLNASEYYMGPKWTNHSIHDDVTHTR